MSFTSHSSPLVRAAARVVRALIPGDVYRGIGDARLRTRSYRAFGLSGDELSGLLKTPRFQKTPFHLLNHEVHLTDSLGGYQCIQELLLEEVYRFRSDRPDPKIIDCGANVGLSIIYFKHLYPQAEIVAFEPDPQIFKLLEENVRAFGFSGVTLRREAVWTEEGELHFVPDGGFGGRTEPLASGATAATSVKSMRLRDLLAQPVTLLKLDIEGAEVAVIEDCRDHLANVERLFVEYHGHRDEPQQLGEMLGHLKRAGFRYHLKEATGLAHPFLPEERAGSFDLQMNVFASRD